jgi:hypothetical protein
MEFAPQDFVNLVSSYLPWMERRTICDNSSIFSKAYSDKLFIADTKEWALSSQMINLEDLVSQLCSSYALVVKGWTSMDSLNNNVILAPTAEIIISIVEGTIESIGKSRKMQIDVSINKRIGRLNIEAYIRTPFNGYQTDISLVSNEDVLMKVGLYLCNLKRKNVEIYTEHIKNWLECSENDGFA